MSYLTSDLQAGASSGLPVDPIPVAPIKSLENDKVGGCPVLGAGVPLTTRKTRRWVPPMLDVVNLDFEFLGALTAARSACDEGLAAESSIQT